MKNWLKKVILKYGPIIFLLLFASLEFFLLFRHKSPYTSDSYFYKHIFYTFQGNSYSQAREVILTQIDFSKIDEISKNFYLNNSAYKNTLGFFTKRPLYPFLAFLINFVINNEFISFLMPVYLAFISSIYLAIWFLKKGHNHFYATLAGVLFISFYPFLDWSTYFLTDTIGTFFWFLQTALIFKYFMSKNIKWLWSYLIILVISFFNREQSLLMPLLIIVMFLLFLNFKLLNKIKKQIIRLLLLSLLVTVVYIVYSIINGQKTLYDTIVYTQNSYGLESKEFLKTEVLQYWSGSIIKAHKGFIKDLSSHHWWFANVIFALFGVIKLLFFNKKPVLVELLIFSSAIASYLAIFLYPVLSYRYFIPVVLAVCYFSVKFISGFFNEQI